MHRAEISKACRVARSELARAMQEFRTNAQYMENGKVKRGIAGKPRQVYGAARDTLRRAINFEFDGVREAHLTIAYRAATLAYLNN